MSKKVLEGVQAAKRAKAAQQQTTKVVPAEEKAVKQLERIARNVDHSELDAAVKELVQASLDKNPTVNVEIDAEAIGRAVGEQIERMPPPVVTVAPREPRSYKFSIDRDSRGNMKGGEIHPITT